MNDRDQLIERPASLAAKRVRQVRSCSVTCIRLGTQNEPAKIPVSCTMRLQPSSNSRRANTVSTFEPSPVDVGSLGESQTRNHTASRAAPRRAICRPAHYFSTTNSMRFDRSLRPLLSVTIAHKVWLPLFEELHSKV